MAPRMRTKNNILSSQNNFLPRVSKTRPKIKWMIPMRPPPLYYSKMENPTRGQTLSSGTDRIDIWPGLKKQTDPPPWELFFIAFGLDAFFYVELSGRALVSMAAISGSMPRLTRGENMYRTIYDRAP